MVTYFHQLSLPAHRGCGTYCSISPGSLKPPPHGEGRVARSSAAICGRSQDRVGHHSWTTVSINRQLFPARPGVNPQKIAIHLRLTLGRCGRILGILEYFPHLPERARKACSRQGRALNGCGSFLQGAQDENNG